STRVGGGGSRADPTAYRGGTAADSLPAGRVVPEGVAVGRPAAGSVGPRSPAADSSAATLLADGRRPGAGEGPAGRGAAAAAGRRAPGGARGRDPRRCTAAACGQTSSRAGGTPASIS